MYPATWGSAVSSVTWSGGNFSRLRKRREETWSLRPAWWSSFLCSPSLPVSPTATGEREEGGEVANEGQGIKKLKFISAHMSLCALVYALQ